MLLVKERQLVIRRHRLRDANVRWRVRSVEAGPPLRCNRAESVIWVEVAGGLAVAPSPGHRHCSGTRGAYVREVLTLSAQVNVVEAPAVRLDSLLVQRPPSLDTSSERRYRADPAIYPGIGTWLERTSCCRHSRAAQRSPQPALFRSSLRRTADHWCWQSTACPRPRTHPAWRRN